MSASSETGGCASKIGTKIDDLGCTEALASFQRKIPRFASEVEQSDWGRWKGPAEVRVYIRSESTNETQSQIKQLESFKLSYGASSQRASSNSSSRCAGALPGLCRGSSRLGGLPPAHSTAFANIKGQSTWLHYVNQLCNANNFV